MGVVRRSLKKRNWGLKQEILVLYFAIRDPHTPLYAKLTVLFSLTYLLSPIDLIPDFIPFIGYLDDLILVPLLLHLSFRFLPGSVIETSRIKAKTQAGKIRFILIMLFLLLVMLMAGVFFLGKSIFHEIRFAHW